jgi:N-glycosylase/DNA lyase
MDGPRGEVLSRFPDLAKIAALEEDDLRSRGFGYRARTIPDIARQIAARGGRTWLESLKGAEYEEAHAQLTEIRGIGPKLADCVCLFALHHVQAVPVDTHLWQAARRHYFPAWKGKALTARRYKEVGDEFRRRFGPLAGWAHQYLFYDNLKNWRTYRKPVQS